MSDLVKRLRYLTDDCGLVDGGRAAERIERLEAVLVQAREAMIVLHSGPFGVKSGASVQAIAAIDTALKE